MSANWADCIGNGSLGNVRRTLPKAAIAAWAEFERPRKLGMLRRRLAMKAEMELSKKQVPGRAAHRVQGENLVADQTRSCRRDTDRFFAHSSHTPWMMKRWSRTRNRCCLATSSRIFTISSLVNSISLRQVPQYK